jgi:hypothetical protein
MPRIVGIVSVVARHPRRARRRDRDSVMTASFLHASWFTSAVAFGVAAPDEGRGR